MKTILASLVLLPAAALAQFPDYDQGPNTGTEGDLVQIPAGQLLTSQYVGDRVVFDRPTAVNAFTVYAVTNPGPLRVEINLDNGSLTPADGVRSFGNFVTMPTDLGPVPGSALGLRAFALDVRTDSLRVAAGSYWVLLRSGDQRAFSLATVRNSRDDLSYGGNRVPGEWNLASRPGDLMMQIGSVPEPASMAVLGLGLAAWKRRKGG